MKSDERFPKYFFRGIDGVGSDLQFIRHQLSRLSNSWLIDYACDRYDEIFIDGGAKKPNRRGANTFLRRFCDKYEGKEDRESQNIEIKDEHKLTDKINEIRNQQKQSRAQWK